MSKCWICGKEMTKTIGGCEQCNDCGVGLDDLVFRTRNHSKDNSLDNFVERYPTYIEALDIIDDLKKQLEEKDKIEYTDTINFVETSEPDIVAKELDRLNEQLAESEKQRQYLKDWLDNEILTSVDNESYYATINEYEEEVKKLKQQLEEKDADIIALDTDNYSFKQQIDNLRQQLKSQPKEIVEKIRRKLGLKLKYKLNDEVYVLKICNQINEVLDTILKDYQK